MEIEELAAAFEGVTMRNHGFIARCPAHPDRSPSLRVEAGNTGWLVKCYSGCTFFDIVTAAGLQPLNFKYDSAPQNPETIVRTDKARSKLIEMIEAKRTIPTTLGAISEIALHPDPRIHADVSERYQLMDYSIPDALRVFNPTMDGPVWELIEGDWIEYGKDWQDAKRKIGRLLWNTYVSERGHLATR
jgi:hypothetical protein